MKHFIEFNLSFIVGGLIYWLIFGGDAKAMLTIVLACLFFTFFYELLTKRGLMRKTKFYIHTINGSPGTFDGEKICYAPHYGEANSICADLNQIKRERKLSQAYDRKWRQIGQFAYGHRRYG